MYESPEAHGEVPMEVATYGHARDAAPTVNMLAISFSTSGQHRFPNDLPTQLKGHVLSCVISCAVVTRNSLSFYLKF